MVAGSLSSTGCRLKSVYPATIQALAKTTKEPLEWNLSEIYDIEYVGGKCALWGFPYSSMPIFFDDLVIRSN